MKKYASDEALEELIRRIKAEFDSQVVHQNLLDNWDFQNAVNQRNKALYTADGYTIDRWLLHSGSNTTGKLAETAYGLELSRASGSDYVTLVQRVDTAKRLLGKTVTFSVLHSDNSLTSVTFQVPGAESFPSSGTYGAKSSEVLIPSAGSIYMQCSGSNGNISFECVLQTTTSTFKIAAAKLEFGDHQTLAHKEESTWVLNERVDFAAELVKCQRYYEKMTYYNGTAYAFDSNQLIMDRYDFKVSKRAFPTFVINPEIKADIIDVETNQKTETEAVLAMPGIKNTDMFAPVFSGTFVPGKHYRVFLPDLAYEITADI